MCEKKRVVKSEKVDYTGCDPEIAEVLQRGDRPVCRVYDSPAGSNQPATIIAYKRKSSYPYVGYCCSWQCATPIYEKKRVTVVKSASAIVKWLEEHGYYIDRNGCWKKGVCDTHFSASMFYYCGSSPEPLFDWLPEWLEEV